MVNWSTVKNDFRTKPGKLAMAMTQTAPNLIRSTLSKAFSYGVQPPYYVPPHCYPPPQFYAPPPPPPAFYNRPGKPPAPRQYTPAFGVPATRPPPPLWYLKSKVPVPAWYQARASFGAKKLVHAPRSSGTHSTFKKARTTTVNGSKRVLYKKIKVRGHKPRCLASASYKPFMTTRQGQTLYLRHSRKVPGKRHSKKVTGKLGGHRFGYDDESETPMYFGDYY